MRNVLKYLLLLCLLCCSLRGTAQRNAAWCFGDSIFMQFGPSGPQVDTAVRTVDFYEMGTSIADEQGNLILYMNHDSIFNRHHKAIDFYKFLDTQDEHLYSLGQGAIIMPVSGRENVYNCIYQSFSEDTIFGFYSQLYNVVVDAGWNNFMGKIIRIDTLLTPQLNFLISEKMLSIKHSNGQDWWIILHGSGNSNFYSILINQDGFNFPIVQSYGQSGTNQFSVGFGEMAASQDGSRLLIAGVTANMYDFDRCTGLISNWQVFDTVSAKYWYYGASFSADGSKIYLSSIGEPEGTSFIPPRLYQFDLIAPNLSNSKVLIHEVQDSNFIAMGQHQIGPDGKIYIASFQAVFDGDSANYKISVIHDPNQSGSACNFEYLGLDLKGRRSTLNLPNHPNYDLGPIPAMAANLPYTIKICAGDTLSLYAPDTSGGRCTFHWTSTGPVSDSLRADVQVWPAASCWYYLEVRDTTQGACGVTRDSVWIAVAPLPQANAGADTSVCQHTNLLLGGLSTGLGYQWTTLAGDTLGVDSLLNYTALQTDTFLLIVSGDAVCAVARDTVIVSVAVPPVADAGPDKSVCVRANAVLGGMSTGDSYTWTNLSGNILGTDSLLIYTVMQSEPLILTVTGPSECPLTQDTVIVSLLPERDCHAPGLWVYPNPTDGVLYLEYAGAAGDLRYAVWNALGQSVMVGVVEVDGYVKYGLDMAQIAAGMYLVQVEIPGILRTYRIVKHD